MSKFRDSVIEASRRADSLVCVGLDFDPGLAPSTFDGTEEAIFAFNRAIIDATVDLVCAYKPNLAFYEALGLDGLGALKRTVEYVPDGVLVIGDAKRGDIGNSARFYARAAFEVFGFDAITVNPYMGGDSLDPFLSYPDRGVFILCKTSNPGADDLQELRLASGTDAKPRPLYEIVAEKAVAWNTKGNCGLVVGATYPEQLARVREIAADLPILIPGVGAQAGDLELAIKNGVDRNGELAIVNSSRQIIYASRAGDFALAARKAALALRDAINKARERV